MRKSPSSDGRGQHSEAFRKGNLNVSFVTIAKTWKQPGYTRTDEWIKKMCYMYTMEYYSAKKRNEIMPFSATLMDLEIIILSEVNQTEKDKYYMITYTWNLKYDAHELIYKAETGSFSAVQSLNHV